MAKEKKVKTIAPKDEFKKFITNLYSESIQLNFDSYFYISHIGTKFYLSFPKNLYYKLDGEIDLTSFPSLVQFFGDDECSVKFDNSEVDALRKLTLKSFLDLSITDNEYTLNTFNDKTNEHHSFILKKEPCVYKVRNYNFKYSIDITKEDIFEKSIIQVYLNNDNLTYERTDDMVFDSPVINFKNVYKKDVSYKLYATEKDGLFRIVMFEATNPSITIRQYFKVI